ncbi:hypothetical protein BC831DRAFT_512399 [Entophlyctis helioformis]|nr:hypothetical protein BC831DRAFT_512399 [Entophlyctis helioformis]
MAEKQRGSSGSIFAKLSKKFGSSSASSVSASASALGVASANTGPAAASANAAAANTATVSAPYLLPASDGILPAGSSASLSTAHADGSDRTTTGTSEAAASPFVPAVGSQHGGSPSGFAKNSSLLAQSAGGNAPIPAFASAPTLPGKLPQQSDAPQPLASAVEAASQVHSSQSGQQLAAGSLASRTPAGASPTQRPSAPLNAAADAVSHGSQSQQQQQQQQQQQALAPAARSQDAPSLGRLNIAAARSATVHAQRAYPASANPSSVSAQGLASIPIAASRGPLHHQQHHQQQPQQQQPDRSGQSASSAGLPLSQVNAQMRQSNHALSHHDRPSSGSVLASTPAGASGLGAAGASGFGATGSLGNSSSNLAAAAGSLGGPHTLADRALHQSMSRLNMHGSRHLSGSATNLAIPAASAAASRSAHQPPLSSGPGQTAPWSAFSAKQSAVGPAHIHHGTSMTSIDAASGGGSMQPKSPFAVAAAPASSFASQAPAKQPQSDAQLAHDLDAPDHPEQQPPASPTKAAAAAAAAAPLLSSSKATKTEHQPQSPRDAHAHAYTQSPATSPTKMRALHGLPMSATASASASASAYRPSPLSPSPQAFADAQPFPQSKRQEPAATTTSQSTTESMRGSQLAGHSHSRTSSTSSINSASSAAGPAFRPAPINTSIARQLAASASQGLPSAQPQQPLSAALPARAASGISASTLGDPRSRSASMSGKPVDMTADDLIAKLRAAVASKLTSPSSQQTIQAGSGASLASFSDATDGRKPESASRSRAQTTWSKQASPLSPTGTSHAANASMTSPTHNTPGSPTKSPLSPAVQQQTSAFPSNAGAVHGLQRGNTLLQLRTGHLTPRSRSGSKSAFDYSKLNPKTPLSASNSQAAFAATGVGHGPPTSSSGSPTRQVQFQDPASLPGTASPRSAFAMSTALDDPAGSGYFGTVDGQAAGSGSGRSSVVARSAFDNAAKPGLMNRPHSSSIGGGPRPSLQRPRNYSNASTTGPPPKGGLTPSLSGVSLQQLLQKQPKQDHAAGESDGAHGQVESDAQQTRSTNASAAPSPTRQEPQAPATSAAGGLQPGRPKAPVLQTGSKDAAAPPPAAAAASSGPSSSQSASEKLKESLAQARSKRSATLSTIAAERPKPASSSLSHASASQTSVAASRQQALQASLQAGGDPSSQPASSSTGADGPPIPAGAFAASKTGATDTRPPKPVTAPAPSAFQPSRLQGHAGPAGSAPFMPIATGNLQPSMPPSSSSSGSLLHRSLLVAQASQIGGGLEPILSQPTTPMGSDSALSRTSLGSLGRASPVSRSAASLADEEAQGNGGRSLAAVERQPVQQLSPLLSARPASAAAAAAAASTGKAAPGSATAAASAGGVGNANGAGQTRRAASGRGTLISDSDASHMASAPPPSITSPTAASMLPSANPSVPQGVAGATAGGAAGGAATTSTAKPPKPAPGPAADTSNSSNSDTKSADMHVGPSRSAMDGATPLMPKSPLVRQQSQLAIIGSTEALFIQEQQKREALEQQQQQQDEHDNEQHRSEGTDSVRDMPSMPPLPPLPQHVAPDSGAGIHRKQSAGNLSMAASSLPSVRSSVVERPSTTVVPPDDQDEQLDPLYVRCFPQTSPGLCVLEPGWDTQVFQDQKYNIWRRCMLEVLQQQIDYPLITTPDLSAALHDEFFNES